MGSTAYLTKSSQQIRDIDRIEVLILLDLIGAENLQFFNLYPNTVEVYKRFMQIERSLFSSGLMAGNKYMFVPRNRAVSIDDDHRPFLEKGKYTNKFFILIKAK